MSIIAALVPAIVSLSVSFEKYDFSNQEIDMRILRQFLVKMFMVSLIVVVNFLKIFNSYKDDDSNLDNKKGFDCVEDYVSVD